MSQNNPVSQGDQRPDNPVPNLRKAVRAVVFDPSERVFLVRFTFPDREFWATPGGGIESGETDLAALTRELAEEMGDVNVRAAVVIWTRTHIFPLGQYDGQQETYYFVRVDSDQVSPLLSAEELRAEHVTASRWWTIPELLAAPHQFAPRRLPALLADLVHHGPPANPVDAGV